MSGDVTQLLQAAQSPDAGIRAQAEAQLKALEAQPAPFLLALSAELANADKPVDARRLAGLIFKNTLDAKDAAKKAALAAQWSALDAGVRAQVKASLLAALGAPLPDVAHTAALAVAKAGALEVPARAWPELLPALLGGAAAAGPARRAATEALGYLCEELGAMDEDHLGQDQVNAILTAVVGGMAPDEPDAEVRLAATTALNNALEFAQSNFRNEAERNFVMRRVCEGTGAGDARVRRAAWECLARVAAYYYDVLPPYMADIFALTTRAVRGDEEAVALQAFEFWCTVAEEEEDRADEPDPARPGHGITAAALPSLVPLLLEQLTKQEEGQEAEDGAWNVSTAAGTCLGLAAAVVGDAAVELVMPYVQANVQAPDWRAREAATFAFGSILEGPSPAALAGIVRPALGFLLAALRDAHPQVKNTTAWAIGRILEFVHGPEVQPPLLGPQNLPAVVGALLEAARDAPHVAEKVCYAVSQLAAGFGGAAAGGAPTSPLSPYFKDLVQALLEAAARPAEGAERARLQTQALEAVAEVVRCSAADAAPLVAQLVPAVVARLGEALASGGGDAAEATGLLCGVLQVVVQRLADAGEPGRAAAAAHADAVVEALLRAAGARPGTLSEEALLALGAVTYATGRGFAKYLPAVAPALEAGLARHQEAAVCAVAVGLLGDACRAAEEQLAPYAPPLVAALLADLRADECARALKPQMLGVLGDLALALGERFEPFLPAVAPVLGGAAALCVQQGAAGGGDAEFLNALRLGVCEAWAGLLNGLPRRLADAQLAPLAPGAVEFAEACGADGGAAAAGVWKAAAALLGDLASGVSGAGALLAARPETAAFLAAAARDDGAGETARWAAAMIRAAAAQSGQSA